MIFTSILTLITAQALPSLNRRNLSSIYITRISAIIFLYAGLLSLNSFNIETIGSGIGIYNGLFQITQVSILLESFLFLIGAFILVGWPIFSLVNPNLIGNSNSNIDHLVSEPYNMSTSSLSISSMAGSAEPTMQLRSAHSPATKSGEYSLIVLFSTLGSSLLISSFDLISLYISIELQSFGLYVLATLYRDSETSTKAGLKYFLLGGLSSCIILLGCGLVYSYTGLTNFESIYSIISTSNSYLPNASTDAGAQLNLVGASLFFSENLFQGLNLGLILIFIGFLFKIAAAPLHNWSPDVYDEVPTIVTTWLTIIPKISILVLLLELQYYAGEAVHSVILNNDSNSLAVTRESLASATNLIAISTEQGANSLGFAYIIKILLLVSSFLSLLIGTIVGLAQTRIKRLLAFSTISHIGFILLALAINTESSIDSLLFYIMQYTITNLDIFLIILAFSYIPARFNSISSNFLIKDIRYIRELSGKYLTNPLLAISLAICLFSMAGIPPLIGFFSKQFVLYSAIQNGYYFISLIAIGVSVISASYYIKIVKVLFSEGCSADNNVSEDCSTSNAGEHSNINFSGLKVPLLQVHSYLISILTLSILLFIFKPYLILNSTQLLSLSLFNW